MKTLYYGEVAGSNPVGSTSFWTNTQTKNEGDTWCPSIGPHVSLLFAFNRTRVTLQLGNHQPIRIRHVMKLPSHHTIAMSAVRPTQSTSFFFPVWWFEQIAITFAPDVRLRRNELRWVRDNEGYAHVRFEAIPRTLIFGLKFDPWSRFWSLIRDLFFP